MQEDVRYISLQSAFRSFVKSRGFIGRFYNRFAFKV